MSSALMLLCHRPPHYAAALAQRYPQLRVYVHYDAKSDVAELASLRRLANVHVLAERTHIHWAGFSMVAATLALMRAALADSGNRYFHLIRGDCVLLQPPAAIEAEIARPAPGTLFRQSQPSHRLRYRLRWNAPHADTRWQRRLPGKLLTKCWQAADRLWPAAPVASGSQWFSADRTALQALLAAANNDTQAYFRHKLCPDEHFFQYLLARLPETVHHINHNRRYLCFHGSGNHPQWLDLPQLQQLGGSENWFARKVHTNTALALLDTLA